MMQGAQAPPIGVFRFYSKDELRRFLKSLVEQYQAQSQALGDELGTLIRTLEQEKAAAKAAPKDAKDSKGKDQKDKPQPSMKGQSRGWVKMGTMMVNVSDPNGAMAEVLFQMHEDVKTKLAKSTEALKSFEELNSQMIPEAGQYYLQVRNGAPEKIVANLSAGRRELFSFSADFKLV